MADEPEPPKPPRILDTLTEEVLYQEPRLNTIKNLTKDLRNKALIFIWVEIIFHFLQFGFNIIFINGNFKANR